MNEPLSPPEARRLVREIISTGIVSYDRRSDGHFLREAAKDGLSVEDCMNVLRGGWVEPGEWENGAWRYRVHSARIVVVIEFESETELFIVTTWRKK